MPHRPVSAPGGTRASRDDAVRGVTAAPHRTAAPRWLAPTLVAAVLAIAALIRFWALNRPDVLVFDELYYVRDAVSQLAHGFPTTWPDKDPAFGGARAEAFSDVAASIAHPPLGKWLIGLGVLAFGPDTGWGWRSAVAAAGVATVALTMRLGWLMSRNLWVALLAGLVLALDGVHVTLSRVALLDGFLTMFVVLGALFVWRDLAQSSVGRRDRPRLAAAGRVGIGRSPWWRPWWLAAGAAFGAAAAVKWSGLYPLLAFLLLSALVEAVRLVSDGSHRPVLGAGLRGLAAAVHAVPVAIAVYLASWTGWIVTSGGQGREPGVPWWVSLWRWHAHAYEWHSTLSAPHPYQSHPLSWPLALRPTGMLEEHVGGTVSVVSPLPNALIALGGVAALCLLGFALLRVLLRTAKSRSLAPMLAPGVAVAAFVLTGYLSGWLPWVFTFGRSAVYQFYAVVLTPFAALALALVLASIASAPGAPRMLRLAGINLEGSKEAVFSRRIAVGMFLAITVVLSALYAPVWMGVPIAEWFWTWHIWLPGWS